MNSPFWRAGLAVTAGYALIVVLRFGVFNSPTGPAAVNADGRRARLVVGFLPVT